MYYESTRGQMQDISSALAIKTGIAPDGGLFVPNSKVSVNNKQILDMTSMTYVERVVTILKLFLTDYSEEELREAAETAYSFPRFDTPTVAPVHKINEKTFFLELWHGPTCAFKDMALQIMPRLLVKAVAKTKENNTIVILVATSGDTGKAALEGFRDVAGTKIIVFFPNQGVSEIQRLQMVTQEGNNVYVAAVQGNFDDTQTGVKIIFTNPDIGRTLKQQGYSFSSANSINWGRLVPQIVYYFSAYADLISSNQLTVGQPVNFVVPTGNFGNILAGFYARQMGLPINRLICAANENNVLTDFIRTGRYDKNRRFVKTISPSMDILISSNLERLLYELTNHEAKTISGWMQQLSTRGFYEVGENILNKIKEIFWSDFADDDKTLAAIKDTFEKNNYLIDTHTAVGKHVYDKYALETGDETATVIVSTASPFKFNSSVATAILGKEKTLGKNEFELLELLKQAGGIEIPEGLKNLEQKPVLHTALTAKENMGKLVKEILLDQ